MLSQWLAHPWLGISPALKHSSMGWTMLGKLYTQGRLVAQAWEHPSVFITLPRTRGGHLLAGNP